MHLPRWSFCSLCTLLCDHSESGASASTPIPAGRITSQLTPSSGRQRCFSQENLQGPRWVLSLCVKGVVDRSVQRHWWGDRGPGWEGSGKTPWPARLMVKCTRRGAGRSPRFLHSTAPDPKARNILWLSVQLLTKKWQRLQGQKYFQSPHFQR